MPAQQAELRALWYADHGIEPPGGHAPAQIPRRPTVRFTAQGKTPKRPKYYSPGA